MSHDLEAVDPESHIVIGAGIDVHRTLGCGFPENVYQEAFEIELADRRIPFVREAALQIRFKGGLLRVHYRVDFICFERLLVELKATPQILRADYAQMISYLKAAGAERGLVLNFGGPVLEVKRVVFSSALHEAAPGMVESAARSDASG